MTEKLVFLLDVDNTLLDGDRIVDDLRLHLERELGSDNARRYWELFEVARAELGYVDYLDSMQRLRRECELKVAVGHRLLSVADFLIDYPFAERLYPRALEVLEYLGRQGTTVLLTDGDVVYQPRKLRHSGLWDAVAGRVLIYAHKEQRLADVQQNYPAGHYVMVDDKLPILAAMKTIWKDGLTSVFPRQGHYALDPAYLAGHAAADVTIEHIAELIGIEQAQFMTPPKQWAAHSQA